MPFYEFQCSKGTVTEKIVPMDTKSITCPDCGKRAKKIISPCSFKLVGGGWYADGYSSSKSADKKEIPQVTKNTLNKKLDDIQIHGVDNLL